MNSVVIHNDNIIDLTLFTTDIKYPPLDNVDENISKNILSKIAHDADVIFIKDNLSSNYLELLGLRVAYHVRLSQELWERRFLPIVIISNLDVYSLNKLDTMANILFTKNIFLIENTQEAIKNAQDLCLTKLSTEEYQSKFLQKIEVEQPKDYLSHHSITNAWAIDQWAYFYGVNDDNIMQNRRQISSMLYYKFLKVKHQLHNKIENQNIKSKEYSGKVLLVDDQSSAGWYSIMQEFCKKHYSNVELDYLQNIQKDLEITDIFELLISKINQFLPDVMLLDLRLLESDDNLSEENLNINKLSGIQLLKKIKQLNPSIQIIMFTASSDGMILDELYKYNILGYVKKDAPADKYRVSKNNFNKLDSLIRLGLSRKYLKELWNIQEKSLQLPFFENPKDDKIKELRENIKTIFEVANSNIPRHFTYSMLAIYKCLELLNHIYIIDDFKNAKWRDTKKLIEKHTDNSTKNYIYNIIKYKTNLSKADFENRLHEITCSRNYAIHTSIKSECRDITRTEPTNQNISEYFSKYIVVWYEMLFEIINAINESKF